MKEGIGRAKGGIVTAAKMTLEERKARAMKGVAAKKEMAGLPRATHPGILHIGDIELDCVVLEDGKRLFTRTSFLKAIGRTGKAKGGRAYDEEFNLPVFLTANNLKPFISNELYENSSPIIFKNLNGTKSIGYRAELIPQVCGVFMDADTAKVLASNQMHIAEKCKILIRGFATVGIIALVDEATGYQKDRAKDELSKILEAFVAKELQPWVKTFPFEFYEQMFRLRGLPFPSDGVKRPQYFGHLTNDIIYRRLAPGVWKELKEQSEKNEKGRLKNKLHQRLTIETGHPKLKELVVSVTTVMKLSDQWQDFKSKLDRVHPAYNETMMLPFALESDTGKGI